MKISKNVMIVCLLFGGHSVSVFGAFNIEKGQGAAKPSAPAPRTKAPELPAKGPEYEAASQEAVLEKLAASEPQGKPAGEILAVTIKVILDYLQKPANERNKQDIDRVEKAVVAFMLFLGQEIKKDEARLGNQPEMSPIG